MIKYSNKIPDKSEFYPLYVQTGWIENLDLNPEQLQKAIHNSYFVVSVYDNDTLIGFGRVVSDGAAYATLNDIIVAPKWQSQGIGSTIIRKLVRQCELRDIKHIHLFASKTDEYFFNHLGFVTSPFDSPGMVYQHI